MEHLEAIPCPSCGVLLDAAATFCARCGVRSPATSSSASGKWYHNVWFVLIMLFLVLGPFGLPLVWQNPRFSRRVKIVLTLITVVYTLLLVYGTIAAVRVILNRLLDSNALWAL